MDAPEEQFENIKAKYNTYSSLEDTFIAPVSLRCLLDLFLRGIRVDDAVLAGNLLAVLLLVVALDALVLVELRLEKGLERLQLGGLCVAGVVRGAGEVALEALDTVLDGRVADLRLGDVLLQLLVGLAVGGAERALVKLADGVNVARQAADLVAQVLDAAEELVLRQAGRLLLLVALLVALLLVVVVVLHLIIVLRIGVRLRRGRLG